MRPSLLVALLRALFLSALAGSLFGCQVLFGHVEISDAPQGADQCTVGEYRCNGEYLLSCASGSAGWTLKDTCESADMCDPKGKLCTVCKDSDRRCVGADRQGCKVDGSGWDKIESCDSEPQCSATGCGPCAAGAYDCAGQPQVQLRKCNASGSWDVEESCANPALCSSSLDMAMSNSMWDGHCVAPGCGTPGQYQCTDDLRLQRCPPDQTAWVDIDTCPSAAVCAQVSSAANSSTDTAATTLNSCKGACDTAGAFMCDGMMLKQCRSDLTAMDTVTTCTPGTECNPVEGDCGQPCQPGAFQCNGITLRQCQSDHSWKNLQDCATAALCVAADDGSTGSCTPPACMAGDYKCDGVALEKCKDDLSGFQPQDTCLSAALCDATSARCDPAACTTAGALQCNGQQLQQCSADLTQWTSITTCAAGQFCDTDLSQPCKMQCPSPQRCNGRVLENCTPQGWQAQSTCATSDLCNCTLTDPDGAGPLTNSCLLGVTTDGCGVVACGGSKAGYQCQGAELQKCQAGRNGWDNSANCGSNNLCYPGVSPGYANGYCLTCPTAGELYCMGKTLDVCSADRKSWNTSATCGSSGCIAVQNGQDYCAVCAKGSVQCSGSTLQQCASDQHGYNNTTCASAALCDAKNDQCDVCTPGATCNGLTLNVCRSDGQALQSQKCANVCDAANKQCDQCTANDVWCDGAVLYKCSADGQSKAATTCLTADLCDATHDRCNPATCAVGATQCNGTQPQICNPGRTGFANNGAACATNALCTENSGKSCAKAGCTPNTQKCNGTELDACNSGETAYDTKLDTCATTQLCDPSKTKCTAAACGVGQNRCNGAQPQVCNAGRTDWSNVGTSCGTTALCNPSNGTCYACTAGQPRCDGVQPEVCNTARTGWAANGGACATSALCDPVTFMCDSPVCGVGDMQCDDSGTQVQVCNAARTGWDNMGDPCLNSCVNGACT